jgi:hypothetical protein
VFAGVAAAALSFGAVIHFNRRAAVRARQKQA